MQDDYPMFALVRDGEIQGWLSVSPYRQGRAALRRTVEISYFVRSGVQGKGIGSQLLAYGLDACRHLGYKTALAIILDKNEASIRLVKKYGFEQWAFLPAVAEFNGVVCSHLYFGMHLESHII
jgi:L-amino acid N-acyltransferase YncA